MNIGNRSNFAVFIRCKRKNLKWYQKLWNFIAGHKDRNWCWMPFNKKGE